LPLLCDPHSAAIDVGAANGVYSTRLLHYSTHCYAFEPVPERAERLANALRGKVTVFQQALSSEKGTAMLTIPVIDDEKVFGRATIEPENSMSAINTTSIEVCVTRLDDIELPRISFIKIDVEGHEIDVLIGGLSLIERDKPSILVEAEERHKSGAISGICRLLESIGYKGFFLMNGKLYSISEFDLSVHQPIGNAPAPGAKTMGIYINNFIFIASPSVLGRLQHLY